MSIGLCWRFRFKQYLAKAEICLAKTRILWYMYFNLFLRRKE